MQNGDINEGDEVTPECSSRAVQLLIKERPYVCALTSNSVNGRACFGCFKIAQDETTFRRCGGCHSAWYCDAECQRADWTSGQHRYECVVWTALQASDDPEELMEVLANTELRLITRYIARFRTDAGFITRGEGCDGFPVDAVWRNAGNLQSADTDTVKGRESYWKCLGLFQSVYKEHSRLFQKCSATEFLRAYGVIADNRIIIDGETEVLGQAVYLQASRFDHGCEPELTIRFDGNTLVVNNCVFWDPKETPLKQLRYDYTRGRVVPFWTTVERQMKIMKLLAFACTCDCCSNEDEDEYRRYCTTTRCSDCGQALMVVFASGTDKKESESEHHGVCRQCGDRPVDPDTYDALRRFWGSYASHYQFGIEVDVAEGVNRLLLSKAEKLLHPVDNVVLGKLRFYLLQQLSEKLKANDTTTDNEISSNPELVLDVEYLSISVYNHYLRYAPRSEVFAKFCLDISSFYGSVGNVDQAKYYRERSEEILAELHLQ